jgi:signal transduction histidine kinase
VLLPVLTLVSAAGTAVLADVWAAQRGRLEEQGAELTRLLGEVQGHRQLTDAVVRTVDVGLLALGPKGEYKSMNPRHREFLRLAFPDGHRGTAGQTGAVYAADNLTELTYVDMPSVRAMNGETFSDHTIWVGTDPGSRLALSVSARPLVGERGDVEGAVLAYHDITDLMRALRVKDDFVAAVSHELRTPLTSIIGYLDLAADHHEALPPEVVHYLSVAERNADRLLVLVSDLLTAAQAQGTAMRLTPEPTDLALLVRAAVDGIAQRARVEGLQVRTHVEQMPMVVADPCRVAQVLDNLLSNAVKYTPSGGSIDVVLERGQTGVMLTVKDTGMGVAAGELSSLFTKFFRARNATERAIPGVGLGLVITKAIVDAHGGSIDLASEEGVGTRVRVSLPFVPTGPTVPTEVETGVEQS